MVQYRTGVEITKYECSSDDQEEVEEEEDLLEQTEATKGVKEEGHLGEDTASGSHRKNTKPDSQRPWKNPIGEFRPPPENEMNPLNWASYHMWMANKEWEGHLTFIRDVCSPLGKVHPVEVLDKIKRLPNPDVIWKMDDSIRKLEGGIRM